MSYEASSKRRAAGVALLAFALALAVPGQTLPSKPGGVRGAVFTTDSSDERAFIPGARVQIRPLDGSRSEVELSTDGTGRFLAGELPSARYSITVEFTGLQAAPVEVTVQPGQIAEVEIELKPEAVREAINVSAQAAEIDTTEAASSGTVQQSTLEHAPNVNERVESALPLLPGVVRGPDGLINMKGARSSQNGMLLNSANVTDPVTGFSGINLPIDVVSSAQVVANPYDPEYGKLAGAVATIDTRVSEFDKFHFRLQNFMPRMRKRDGDIVGIESATPRLTITGPVVPGRVAVTQSLEYRYVRTPVNTLPALARDTGLESVDSYTQADLRLTEMQSASVTVALYPQKLNYLGLNTFTPQEATPNLHQRGKFLAFSDKLILQSGSLLSSQVSYKTFDSDLQANSHAPYQLGIDTAAGGFFNRQDRDTNRIEWAETFTAHDISAKGQQQLKAGVDIVRNAYDGQQGFSSVEVLRASGLPAEQIDYSPGVRVSVREREYTAFVLDKWRIHPKLTMDIGLRADRDSVSDEGHLAPRLGLAISPFASGRTVIRGGVGYFYDRINLNIPTFTDLPERTVTEYSAEGVAYSTLTYHHQLAGPLNTPRSTAWNVEIQQQVRPDLTLGAGVNQRNTVRDFFVEPVTGVNSGTLLLSNAGRNRYREFQVTARYQIHQQLLNASYVRSSSIGDLNDFNQFFGNIPNPIIRPNERGRLNFDAPNRVVFWGQFRLPWKITLSPVIDVHTGFPYSVVDEERNFIGPRNQAGRYPRFASTDLQATREITIPVFGKKYKAQAGVRIFNLFDHYNPRDFQDNLASYRYGAFLNSVDRMVRGKLVLEF